VLWIRRLCLLRLSSASRAVFQAGGQRSRPSTLDLAAPSAALATALGASAAFSPATLLRHRDEPSVAVGMSFPNGLEPTRLECGLFQALFELGAGC